MPNSIVQFVTSKGDIKVEVLEDKTPVTAANFLDYVKSGFYDGTIFHRVIPGFVAQGGGFTPGMSQKDTKAPIVNEAAKGPANARGTPVDGADAPSRQRDEPVFHQFRGQQEPGLSWAWTWRRLLRLREGDRRHGSRGRHGPGADRQTPAPCRRAQGRYRSHFRESPLETIDVPIDQNRGEAI